MKGSAQGAGTAVSERLSVPSIVSEPVAGKRVLLRADLNVPLNNNGEISDDTRIVESLETIRYLVKEDATVIIMSHLGRPKGSPDAAYSLKRVSERTAELLERPVRFIPACVGDEVEAAVLEAEPGDVLMLENVRFMPEETENDPEFARKLARLGNIFVNDAFGTVHRAHASTAGVASYIPSFAGFLMVRELHQLGRLLDSPAQPFITIVGGLKVSDKIGVLEHLVESADAVLVGGAMACTFFAAKGFDVGASYVDEPGIELAQRILDRAEETGCSVVLPIDAVVAQSIVANAPTQIVPMESIPAGWMALDIGPRSRVYYATRIAEAHTIFWNGPMGVFEMHAFAGGTEAVADAVAGSPGLTIVGGGDSVAALHQFGLAGRIGHISTGGGASLALLEGADLPVLEALRNAPQ